MKRQYLEELATALELFSKNKLPGVVNLDKVRKEQVEKGFKFDMDVWGIGRECGFAGCAIGLAAMLPFFRRRGLKMDKGGKCHLRGQTLYGPANFEDVADFFGLGYDTAHELFDGANYNGDLTKPLDVAKRIRQVLKENPA